MSAHGNANTFDQKQELLLGREQGEGVLCVPRPGRPLDKNAADIWVALCVFAVWLRAPRGLEGRCYPSLPQIAAAAQVSLPTVRKGLRLLADAGVVRIERLLSGRRVDRTRYTLLPERAA